MMMKSGISRPITCYTTQHKVHAATMASYLMYYIRSTVEHIFKPAKIPLYSVVVTASCIPVLCTKSLLGNENAVIRAPVWEFSTIPAVSR